MIKELFLTTDDLHMLTEELGKLSTKEKDNVLERLRKEVDKIDSEISSLLIERINLIIEIGAIKKSLNLPAYDATREREIEKNICYDDDSGINKALKNIYERIIDVSRSLQREREK